MQNKHNLKTISVYVKKGDMRTLLHVLEEMHFQGEKTAI